MKKITGIVIIILLMISGCGGSKQSIDDFITVDVTKNYPKKELILQDFMDVEYIALETNDDFLTQGMVRAIGKDVIIITNQINDGDIFVFDKSGKGVRKFNHIGQGPGEYANILEIILDDDNDEMFIFVYPEKVLVYDLYGKFKRRFKQKENIRYDHIYNYDINYLICHDGNLYFEEDAERNASSFFIVSKQDGNIIKEIEIPFKKQKSLLILDQNAGTIRFAYYCPITLYNDNWILMSLSSDTIYRLQPDFSMIPFLVRIPSIQSMDTEIFLSQHILTDRYYFMESIKKEQSSFNRKKMMYDKQEKTIHEYTVFNNDYSVRIETMVTSLFLRTISKDIAFYEILEAYKLVDAYKKGELKDGKLKEIASTLDVEDNPVIMLVKHKK